MDKQKWTVDMMSPLIFNYPMDDIQLAEYLTTALHNCGVEHSVEIVSQLRLPVSSVP